MNLHKDGRSKVVQVHRLVAEAFIPNPLCLPTVNHKDGNKRNNSVSNLEWASYSANNVHAIQNNLRKPRGTPVAQYSVDGVFLAEFSSAREASRVTGISPVMICHCLHHRTQTAGGYVFRRISEGVTTIPTGSTLGDELPAEAQEQESLKI